MINRKMDVYQGRKPGPAEAETKADKQELSKEGIHHGRVVRFV